MYGVMASGWTLAIYFAQMIFENIQPILVTYQTYVFWYIGKWSNHSISNSTANQIDFLFFHSNNWFCQLHNLLSIGPTEKSTKQRSHQMGTTVDWTDLCVFLQPLSRSNIRLKFSCLSLILFPIQMDTQIEGFLYEAIPTKT